MAAGPSSAKLFCAEMVSRVADRGVQVHGGLGYMSSTVVERMYRDSRLYRLYEGTSEIQKHDHRPRAAVRRGGRP